MLMEEERTTKKRVGILIDSIYVSKQIYDLLQLSAKSNNYEITTLVINEIDNKRGNFISRLYKYVGRRGLRKLSSTVVFKLVCKCEEIFLKRLHRYSKFYYQFRISENQFQVIKVKPLVSESGLIYRYNEFDIDQIKNAELDLIVRTGSGILRGSILTACPNGIISFHHADNQIIRGSPPGFWEVYKRNPRTGFIIQRLKDELDGGDVIYKGYIATSFCYSLNLVRLYEVANPFIHYVIEDLTSLNPKLYVSDKVPYSFPLYTSPTVYQTLAYLIKTGDLIIEKLLRKMRGKSYRWGVAYQFIEDWRDVTLWRSKKIPNPRNRFLADPFVIFRKDAHYCFVEDYDYNIRKGRISAYKITHDKCEELGIVLSEDFHLSFPYLFEYDNELFMCPETHEKQEIRIYKCVDFPSKWVFHKTIMKDVSAVDTVIFKRGEMWWMLTNIDNSVVEDHGSQLHVFYGTHPLTENWTPHENNPVIFDSFVARNGGFIADRDQIYRAYQRQGFDMYGEACGVAKINLLNFTDYSEEKLFEVEPKFFRGIKGTHTFNFANGLLVLDFVEKTKTDIGA